MIKTRVEQESNYRAIWFNGKTMRFALNPLKPITKLKYPEFYDIKITGKCEGQCPWCYMNSTPESNHVSNICKLIRDFFEPMDSNQRPFQVAIGGGEPTLHPEFTSFLYTLRGLNIVPNYTTNGMFIRDKMLTRSILDATFAVCGGVALSCHPHLWHYWEQAVPLFSKKTVLNMHLIIFDAVSIDYFINIFNKYRNQVNYFVLLPYGNQGRAEHREIDWKYLIKALPVDMTQIAFGANFYPFLQQSKEQIRVSLYEPEIMSAFLDMTDMQLYPSSFNLTAN